MHPEMGYKLCKFYENHARDTPLRSVSIPHFDQISVKISFLGLLYPNRCTDWGETSVPSSVPNFTPIGATCQKPQNWPLSKLNTGRLRFAQCCR